MKSDISRISVIGLGKLGSPMAACFASRDYEVVGADLDSVKVAALNAGTAPVSEPLLQDLISSSKKRLRATTDIREAVRATDATFVIVPTPSNRDGGFALDYVLSACEEIGTALADRDTFHLVVITSTVMPGATGGEIRNALERFSGKRVGHDFGLCYSPEFIALGSVVRDLQHPDFILIGESDPSSGELLGRIYLRTCHNNPPISRMNFVNAEITKIALNSFVTTKITFANTLARICERIPGADVSAVTSALGRDSRVGAKYLKGAIGYGGPCFPRDNLAFSQLAHSVGIEPRLAVATDRANREQVKYLGDMIETFLPGGGMVGVLGLSYKPDTEVVEESQGILLARLLLEQKVSVIAFDPIALPNARKLLGESIQYGSSLKDAVQRSDLLVIATPWPEFIDVPTLLEIGTVKTRVVIDCWNMLGELEGAPHIQLIRLGRGITQPAQLAIAVGS